MNLVFLDTETTGLSRKWPVSTGHRIVEVAALKENNEMFHCLINPGMEISKKAESIHGITNDSLKGKPSFESITPYFLKFIEGCTIVIHNAKFDINFLDNEFERLPPELKPKGVFKYIDTLELARSKFPGRDNSLEGLRNLFKINRQGFAHSAESDVKVLKDVYAHLSNESA